MQFLPHPGDIPLSSSNKGVTWEWCRALRTIQFGKNTGCFRVGVRCAGRTVYSIMAILASLKLQYVVTSASSVTPAYLHAHTDTLCGTVQWQRTQHLRGNVEINEVLRNVALLTPEFSLVPLFLGAQNLQQRDRWNKRISWERRKELRFW